MLARPIAILLLSGLLISSFATATQQQVSPPGQEHKQPKQKAGEEETLRTGTALVTLRVSIIDPQGRQPRISPRRISQPTNPGGYKKCEASTREDQKN